MQYAPGGTEQALVFDRNPSRPPIGGITSATGPHGFTQRAQRQVPPSRKSLVSLVIIRARRVTAAAAAGDVVIEVSINGTLFDRLRFNSNVVGTEVGAVIPMELYLEAAQSIEIYTSDASTGGTCEFVNSVVAVEFDA